MATMWPVDHHRRPEEHPHLHDLRVHLRAGARPAAGADAAVAGRALPVDRDRRSSSSSGACPPWWSSSPSASASRSPSRRELPGGIIGTGHGGARPGRRGVHGRDHPGRHPGGPEGTGRGRPVAGHVPQPGDDLDRDPAGLPDRAAAADQRARPADQGLVAGLHPRRRGRASTSSPSSAATCSTRRRTSRRWSAIALCYLLITIPLSIVVRRWKPIQRGPADGRATDRQDRAAPSTCGTCTSTSATTRCSRASTSTSTTARSSASSGPPVRQVHAAPLREPAGDPDLGEDLRRGHRDHRPGRRPRQGPVPHRDGLPVLQPLPAPVRAAQPHDRPAAGQGPQQGRGRRGRPPEPREGRAGGEGGRLPGPPVRRSAAARRDRPGAVDGPRHDAVRRAHQRPGPRARRGRARGDEGPRLRGHDDDGRDPRDGLRARGRRPARVHGRRRDRRGGRPAEVLADPQHERTQSFLSKVL